MTTDNFCFYLQNRLINTSQTGGQQYNDRVPGSSLFEEDRFLALFYPINNEQCLTSY